MKVENVQRKEWRYNIQGSKDALDNNIISKYQHNCSNKRKQGKVIRKKNSKQNKQTNKNRTKNKKIFMPKGE